MFLLALLSLLGLVYGYPTWRLLADLPLPATTRAVVAAVVFVLAALPVVHVLWLRAYDAPGRARRVVAWIVYLGLGTAVVLFDTVLARDLLGLLARAAAALGALPAGWSDRPEVRAGSAVACLVIGAALLAAGIVAARRPRVRRVDVAIDGLDPAWDGLRIVHLSDLHVSQTIRRGFVARVTERVQALAPDLICFTGDLSDGHLHDLHDEVTPLAGLRAPLGAFFSTGNHEYYYDPAGWLACIGDLGLTILCNGHRVVERDGARLVIGGLPDAAGAEALPGDPAHRADPERVFAGAPDGLRLLLVHQPRAALAIDTGADLTLSGHTHGGQLWPWTLLVRWQQGRVAGLHRHPRRGWLYVSRGVGTWGPPVRLGAMAEIACLTLRRA